ncbi:MAG: Rieske 2Fe-2S domain-containing protein [Bacteroidia bacterium]|jgi:3-phenylpropionate/trans-cinnamate dioxygenase ferredoxin subunit|nr:Rieske 2Fe-2S domain-containing protein [Bacteroidia bacterium]
MFRTVIRWHRIFKNADEALQRIPPGKPLLLHIAGRKVCVVNSTPPESTTAPTFAAIEERCPHNGFSLSRGWTTFDENGQCALVCPLHRYAFGVQNGRRINGGGETARAFPVEVRDDGVFLGTEETQWGWRFKE